MHMYLSDLDPEVRDRVAAAHEDDTPDAESFSLLDLEAQSLGWAPFDA